MNDSQSHQKSETKAIETSIILSIVKLWCVLKKRFQIQKQLPKAELEDSNLNLLKGFVKLIKNISVVPTSDTFFISQKLQLPLDLSITLCLFI